MKMKKTLGALGVGLAIFATCISGCEKKTPDSEETSAVKMEENTSETYTVIQDEDFGSAYIDVTNEEFLDEGFQFGDSLDVIFSNGNKLEDIPFYDGYYVKTNMPVVVAYPGYPHVSIASSSGDSMWEKMGLTAEDTAEVTVRESGKYKDTQEALSVDYSDNREDYGDDAVFANFRSLSGGSLKENVFYRGASAIDNEHNRAGTVDQLIKEKGIRYILDLSDSEEEVGDFVNDNPAAKEYLFTELQGEGNAGMLNLTAAYRSDDFCKTLTTGICEMMKHEGPYYIHCVEGKDRTGFACILLEALCGANYSELENDYMITYNNYYGITKETSPDKYQAFVDLRLNDMLGYLADTEDSEELMNADFSVGAIRYLKNGGMSDEEIDRLVELFRHGL